MVAIMVTLVLMIVISLIVLGFAQISRRNQRQALDRQLSTQAFYAAETGVNDASKLIKNATTNGLAIAPKPDCASNGSGFYTLTPTLDSANNVSYTCLTVNPTPTSLVYSDVGTTSTIVPLIATSGTISKVTLTWQSKDGTTTPANNCPTTASNVFSTTAAWTCGYGVLRFDLVPTAGSLSMAGLQTATMTSFIVPLRPGSAGSANPIAYGPNGTNTRLATVCTNTSCSYQITFAAPQSQYYMRVSSLYKDVSLQIVASDGSGNALQLQGAQAVIDSTGKAQDVLRRIQVRIPLTGSSTNLLSDYAVQSSEAICKRFSVMDGYFLSDANNAVPGVGAGNSDNRLCQTP
jgi:Tfp pilus assembly protein PilX